MCPFSLLSIVLVTFVALEHVGFLVLEMFLWQQPVGRRIFRQTAESAAATALMAKNQGLYNGFLAAGLIWSEIARDGGATTFFLSCVVVAGLYGGWTVNKRIVLVQSLPAVLALAAGCFACA